MTDEVSGWMCYICTYNCTCLSSLAFSLMSSGKQCKIIDNILTSKNSRIKSIRWNGPPLSSGFQCFVKYNYVVAFGVVPVQFPSVPAEFIAARRYSSRIRDLY
uniref:Ovule protein n=1 Tax=Heterorhabditis bacteriophora TaxID=37862 RepID=A0A1I7X9X4_HETBA